MAPGHEAQRAGVAGGGRRERETGCTVHMCTVCTHLRKRWLCGKEGGIERAFACIGLRGERKSASVVKFDHGKGLNQGPENHRNHKEGRGERTAKEGCCPSRHNVNCGCRFWIFCTG